MSQEYCILNLLNIEDKNIKLSDNFYKIENFDGINYKVIKAILTYEPEFCYRYGFILEIKSSLLKLNLLMKVVLFQIKLNMLLL